MSHLASKDQGNLQGYISDDAWIILDTDTTLKGQGMQTRDEVATRVGEMLHRLGLKVYWPKMMIWNILGTLPHNRTIIVARLAKLPPAKPEELTGQNRVTGKKEQQRSHRRKRKE